jgi:RHS repeat-associated protein
MAPSRGCSTCATRGGTTTRRATLDTAVECARGCRDRRARQGVRTRRTFVHKNEQRSMARRARCHRMHSALSIAQPGCPKARHTGLRQRGHWKTLARSTAGCRVGHYNYFRSYSAERGRYTQADPIGLDGGFNRFGYVEGNPLSLTDLYGLLSGAMSCKDLVGGSLKPKISYRPNSIPLESYTWFRPLSYGPSSRQNLDPRFPGRSPVKPVIEIVIQIIEHQKWREQIYTLTELFGEVLTVCEWREKDRCGIETLHSDSNTRDELVGSDEKLTSDEIRWREKPIRTYTIPIPLP